MYATVTTLMFKSDEDLRQAVEGLAALLLASKQMAGFRACYALQTAERTVVMLTACASEASAGAASAHLQPRLAEAVGAHVAGPPERVAGPVLAQA